MKKYVFRFVKGGYTDSIESKTKQQAYSKAKKEYGDRILPVYKIAQTYGFLKNKQ